MFTPQPVEHVPCWLRASGLHVSQPSLNALDGLHVIEKLLVGFRILNNDLSVAVDCQDQWVVCLPEAVEELRRVSFEVAEGSIECRW